MRAASLNHVYRLVWNSVTHTWVVVSEITKSKGKSKSQKAALILTSVMLAGFAGVALAGPEGGVVTGGSGTIDYSGNTTTINQSSQNLYLNWNSFNVAAHETVNFVQPNATALAVNQILDTNGSRILGNINANGQVWLINPNGVYFGQGAQINVGSLLASTLNPLGNTTTNGTQVYGNGGTGSVINEGKITAANGGYVALIANTVSNTGNIQANNGAVALGAGSQVSVTFADNQLLSLTVDQSTLNNLAENKGLIQANGGIALMSAGAKDSLLASVVNNEGVIEAKTVDHKEGKIILMGGLEAGTTKVTGKLDASAQAGDGGFIETSAAKVKIADSANITTKAYNVDGKGGKYGNWLIDPTDFTVGVDISGRALGERLNNTSVEISSVQGKLSGNGDVHINESIFWVDPTTLQITADRNININKNIETVAGKLFLKYAQAGSGEYYLNNNAQINLPSGNSFSTMYKNELTRYFVINSLDELQSIANANNLQMNFALGSNIDAAPTETWNSGKGFQPIGSFESSFSGNFNGLGHTINGLTINRPNESYLGLFGYINNSYSFVRDLGLVNTKINASASINELMNGFSKAVGALAGLVQGANVFNVYSENGNIQGDSFIGGVAGYMFNAKLSNAYAIGGVYGFTGYAGGLVGGAVSGSQLHNVYSNVSLASSSFFPGGGLVGRLVDSSINNAYAIIPRSSVDGALVGENTGGTITNSFSLDYPVAPGLDEMPLIRNNAGNVSNSGLVSSLQSIDVFKQAGWDISDSGFSNSVWRIYDGYSTPLLRNFLTKLEVLPNYAGLETTNLSNIAGYTVGGYDATKLKAAADNTLFLKSTGNDGYEASVNGFYTTDNQGYDVVTRWISTPGTASKEIRLPDHLQWQTGTLNIDGNVTKAGNVISTNGKFELQNGTWNQVNAILPTFSVKDFEIKDGTFIRALGGSGSLTNPYLISDIYGLQGINSDGMLSMVYKLANSIDASGTESWLNGKGFKPIGNENLKFSGVFDGDNKTIKNLSIDQTPVGDQLFAAPEPGLVNSQDIYTSISYPNDVDSSRNVGLFGFTDNAQIRNVGLVDVNIIGVEKVGGIVGNATNSTSIENSFVTGNVSAKTYEVKKYMIYFSLSGGGLNYTGSYYLGGTSVGGIAGSSSNSSLNNTYSTAIVTGSSSSGGLVGNNAGSINNSYSTQSIAGGGAGSINSSFFGTGSAIKSLSNFQSAGWSISDVGGDSTIWRIYDDQTAPMLRSFMTPLNVVVATPDYDGSGNPLTNIGSYTAYTGSYDTTKIFGSLTNPNQTGVTSSLTLTGSAAGGYTAEVFGVNAAGLYSDQRYDLIGVASRTISTPGSATGEIRLPNGINWANGTLNINGNVTNAGAISSTNGVFNLQSGSWNQVDSNLAAFNVKDFRISGGTFVRAVDGDGSSADPYDLVDIYGLKGIQTAPAFAYTLLNDIDASTASNWNGGTGFGMLGNFTGSFDGLNHTISNLTINLPTTDNVGLFSTTNNAVIKNIRLANANVTGNAFVGGLVGSASNTSISNSNVSGTVTGGSNASWVGGMVGNSRGSEISGSYTTGIVNGGTRVGGLAGQSSGTISDSYSNSTINAAGSAGGLIGSGTGTIRNSYASGKVDGVNSGGFAGSFTGTITNSFWNKDTSGKTLGTGNGAVAGLTGLTSVEMSDTSKFINAGWSASGAGGDGTTWRLYEGGDGPLLRSFLKQLYVYSDFDGTAATVNSFNGYQVVGSYDSSKLLGTPNNTLILSSNAAGSYNATVGGLYSTQDGYDIIGRTIATPGSAQGEVTLANGINWNNGTLSVYGKLVNSGAIDWTNGTLNLFGGMGHNDAISWTDGTLNVSGNITNPGDISTTNGQLNINGNWTEVTNQLSNLNVNNWKVGSGFSFIRALGGDGTAANPYQLADVYGLQGVNSSGMLAKNFILANDIDASATSTWNSGAGFESLGIATTKFTGIFDGNSNVISHLTINRPTASNVGLFGYTSNATIRNLGLTDVDVTGNSYVGGMIGRASLTNISNSFVTGSVSGKYYVSQPNTSLARVVATSNVGGMVGALEQGSLTNSYANAYVKSDTPFDVYDPVAGWISPFTSNVVVGGLVGQNTGTISNSYFTGQVQTIDNYNFRVDAITGRNLGTLSNNFVNASNSADGTVLTASLSPAMKTTSNYQNAGWSISGNGGESTVWRIYEDQTGPMLRSFMTQANLGTVTKHYTGQAQNASSAVAGLNSAHVLGTAASGTNAGTYQTAYYSDQLGYDFSGGDLIIDPAVLTSVLNVTGSRVYDGTVTFNAGVLSLGGLVNGETLSLAGYGTVADKNVGTNKALDVTHLTLGNGTGLASNYTFEGGSHLVSITAKALTVTADAANKVYDGNNSATVSLSTADMITGDKLNLNNSSATFSDKHAGQHKTVTVNGIALSGEDAGNYALQNASATDTADIAQKQLTVTADAANKTYDGNTTATLTGLKAGGVISGDEVNLASSSASFSDKQAGNGKTVTVNGITLSGLDANNYSIDNSTTTTADIAKKSLTVIADAQNKTYDGTTIATVNFSSADVVSNDKVGYSANANFNDKNAGSNKAVSINSIGLTGEDAGNYVLQNTSATDTANIAKKALTVSADAANKTYDGTTSATVTLTSTDKVDGDNLNFANTTAVFSNKNAGVNKVVTVSGISINGIDAKNYTLQSTKATDTANIDKKALIITGTTANDKTYDGKTTATATAGTISGFVGAETLNVAIASANFIDKNAGQDKDVTVNYKLSNGSNGGLANNYTLASSVVTADINKAILTYVANAASTTSANMIAGKSPTLSGKVTGFVSGDTLVNSTTGMLEWNLSGNPRLAGKYAITGGGLSSDNYDFVQAVTNSSAFTVRVK